MDPLRPLKLHPGLSPRELLEQMEGASFGARSLGHAWRVLRTILDDSECRVLLTVSGALSVAQLGESSAPCWRERFCTLSLPQALWLRIKLCRSSISNSSVSQLARMIFHSRNRASTASTTPSSQKPTSKHSLDLSSKFHPSSQARSAAPRSSDDSRARFPIAMAARGISSAKRASVRTCSHRLRAWSRPLLRQRPIEATSLSLRSDGGSRRSWRMDPEAEADRSDHARRWCATQLGNADDSIPQKPGMSQAASRGRRHSCLPRSRRIRSLVRKHLFRATTWGKLDPQDLFELRRGARRRDNHLPILMLAAFEMIEASTTRKSSS